MSLLEYQNEEGTERLRLSEREVIIGRLPHSDVWIDDASVSRLHARVVFADGKYRIEDLDSDNGTWVNGEKVKSRVLEPNDSIQCGRVQLRFLE
jgi:pSer/pThr/pTyr-binding forkhead associated (FHA) protein